MVFQLIPNGTYGRRQPGTNGIEGLIARYLVRRAREPGKAGARNGLPILALTTIGRKSGQERTNPVAYALDGHGWLITATAAGAKNHPAWYYNLAACPDRVVIEVDGQRIPVTATQLGPEEAEAKIVEFLATSNAMSRRTFSRYRSATDRVFPTIRLARRP